MGDLVTRFGAVEWMLSNMQARLDRLEQRPRAPAPIQQQTVAKAPGATSKRKRTKAEIKADLLHRISAYVDSPDAAGTLSSLVNAGEYRKTNEALKGAQRAHEARRVQEERKSWTR